MKRVTRSDAGTFVAAACAIGAASLLSRACPAKCGNCAQCAVSAGSLAAGSLAVAGAFAASRRLKRSTE